MAIAVLQTVDGLLCLLTVCVTALVECLMRFLKRTLLLEAMTVIGVLRLITVSDSCILIACLLGFLSAMARLLTDVSQWLLLLLFLGNVS